MENKGFYEYLKNLPTIEYPTIEEAIDIILEEINKPNKIKRVKKYPPFYFNKHVYYPETEQEYKII